eukprot:gnl/Trimastix_PCT/3378.p1 GENE.gnl/Trimastix_PCT/3378~~gnl/Trimastix_PCT/3378.p1  ORF type:complete len:204 (-),score=35.31 gnl/Trimastix_PCT/3378:17-628(-)
MAKGKRMQARRGASMANQLEKIKTSMEDIDEAHPFAFVLRSICLLAAAACVWYHQYVIAGLCGAGVLFSPFATKPFPAFGEIRFLRRALLSENMWLGHASSVAAWTYHLGTGGIYAAWLLALYLRHTVHAVGLGAVCVIMQLLLLIVFYCLAARMGVPPNPIPPAQARRIPAQLVATLQGGATATKMSAPTRPSRKPKRVARK